jgi:TonB family protein
MIISFLLALAVATAPQPVTPPPTWTPYPIWALRDSVGGYMVYDVSVDADGEPTDCRIFVSTGSARLDSEACVMILKHGRFHPAKNADGAPEAGVYRGRLNWTIEG